jgi:ribose 5-phosphate isomerase B
MGIVYIGADHRGWELKNKLKEKLTEEGITVKDLGNTQYDPDDDYPKIALRLAEEVVRNRELGVLICGSGIGATVAANKVKGARAGLCHDPKQAAKGREDDDINILGLAANFLDSEQAFEIVKAFMEAKFKVEDRYLRRLAEIRDYENQ